MNTTNTDATNESQSTSALPEPQVGRNEPCPCGSGKKYKRCHGVDAAPKLSAPTLPAASANAMTGAMGPGGFDPSKADPAMMSQMTKALQRLPRGQLQKLQGIMQRAQAGQDVSREAGEFERMLPPEFSQMAMQMMMAQGMGGAPEMDSDEAKKIVAQAVADGKMTEAQASELLGGQDSAAILAQSEKKGISGFFKKITGK
jgi:uncharacterized protein YecA (UPF0149 family)